MSKSELTPQDEAILTTERGREGLPDKRRLELRSKESKGAA